MAKTFTEQEKADWLKWLEQYGADKLFDSLMRSVQDVRSRCVHCDEPIYCGILEGGGVPDWKTGDGDYGCRFSPETGPDGTGGHCPRKGNF